MGSKNHRDSILTIDDDQVFRSRITKAFAERGLLADQAANSAEAISKVSENMPDLIVLDLMLGQESGLALLPQIIAIHPTAKVLILTGYGTISTAVDAMKYGAINYLTKPVDADTVIAAFLGEVITPNKNNTPKLEQVEWEYIQRVIENCAGNITKASKLLGLHRRSLQRKIKRKPEGLF